MSYGANIPDQFRRSADFVDKILRGTKPGDIPIEQPTRFGLVINLTTAKALGLTLPLLLAIAEEVIYRISLLRCRSPDLAHRDRRRLDGQPSLSGHCGHGPDFHRATICSERPRC